MLSALIAALKVTDRELADAVGVTERTVQRWKRGEVPTEAHRKAVRRFALERLERIAAEIRQVDS